MEMGVAYLRMLAHPAQAWLLLAAGRTELYYRDYYQVHRTMLAIDGNQAVIVNLQGTKDGKKITVGIFVSHTHQGSVYAPPPPPPPPPPPQPLDRTLPI
jgi:hypothetical protein